MSITIKELVDVVSEAGETTKVNAEKQIVALFEKVGAAPWGVSRSAAAAGMGACQVQGWGEGTSR